MVEGRGPRVGLPRSPVPDPQSSILDPRSRLRQVLPHLMPPVRPVVAALLAPVVEVMRNPAAGENPRQAIRLFRLLPEARARRQMDVAAREMVQRPRIRKAWSVVHGIIEVEIVVVVAVHEACHIVDP